ncbi:sarcoglycan complex subunit protein [Ancylostoma caninum]|uniref:Sarcoglycan complex subunit protein n=1 Tax=Ancylostoma caninum TaxID=29170 RepID=A0A368FX04_ANCCA|nr:sarcoglycan complex subunit protein [Ancylostoma caninum]
MSRYPLYGVNDDAVWTRGGSMPEPPRGASVQPLHPSMPYSTYPATTTHTTIVHSSLKPVADADIYKVGIYGWRKRCLYIFILLLTIIIVLNLAMTAWIMSVLDFSTDGMGALKIQEDGIRVEGRAQFDKPVTFSHLSTARDEALTIDSFRGIHMQARNATGQVSARMSLTADGKTQAICNRFEVFDPDNRLLFFADSQEIGLKLENLRILDDGGSVFEGAIQTAFVRPEPDTPLRLESPTRSVSVDAAQDIELLTAAGEVRINSLLDVTVVSKQGEIRLESANIFMDGQPRSAGRGAPQLQLCVCHNGRLFVAAPGADCRADRNICQ